MTALPAGALEWLGVGALLTLLGALIKFRGWTFLLAGYDESAPIPDDVVANVAGNTVLRIGLAAVAFGGTVAVTDVPASLGLVLGGVILVDVLRLVYRLNTYSPNAAA